MTALIGTWQDAYAERASFHVGKDDGSGNSSLSVLVEYRLVAGGQPMKKYHCIIKKDGSFCQRKDGTTEREILEKRYGWDLSDPDFPAENMNPEQIVRVKIDGEDYKGTTRAVIGFVADPNEGPGGEKPDPKVIGAKFGSMLRATAQKIAKPANKAPTNPGNVLPPPAKATPKPIGISNQQECWELFCSTSNEENEQKRTENWYSLLERVNGNVSQDDYASQEWFNVACEIRKHMGKDAVPF